MTASVPKYATHLVYLTSADNPKEIEHKIIYSILNKKPKRADIYWFVHVDTLDDPYTSEYTVEHIIPNDIIRVDFRLGFGYSHGSICCSEKWWKTLWRIKK